MTTARADGWRTPLIVFLAACALLFASFGVRATFGLYLQPVSSDLGWGREIFALSIAIQNIAHRVIHFADGRIAATHSNPQRAKPAEVSW